jgi:hypothetical protein
MNEETTKEPTEEVDEWAKYKDNKVVTKPKITISEGGVCISCEG